MVAGAEKCQIYWSLRLTKIKRKPHKYTEEQIAFIEEHYPGRLNVELAEIFNKKFGTDLTDTQMRSFKSRRGLKSKTAVSILNYEQKKYLMEIKDGLSTSEIADKLNERFDMKISPKQVRSYCSNHGIATGYDTLFKKGNVPYTAGKTWDEVFTKEAQENMRKTLFKKGQDPYNKAPVGTEVKNDRGYTKVKISDKEGAGTKNWEFKHRIIWEKHHGPVSKGKFVTFRDGNKENFDIDNLRLHTRSIFGIKAAKGLYVKGDAELNDFGTNIAELIDLTNKKESGEK